MMESTWMFSCELGLGQNDCGKYELDPKSRGAGLYSGCCSCIHRDAYNAATENAERAYADMASKNEGLT